MLTSANTVFSQKGDAHIEMRDFFRLARFLKAFIHHCICVACSPEPHLSRFHSGHVSLLSGCCDAAFVCSASEPPFVDADCSLRVAEVLRLRR